MRTRLTKLFIILTVTFTTSFAQDFEGKIVYKNTYTSKMPNIPDQQFTSMMGSNQEYFYKDGNYKSSTNGTYFQWQLYIHKENKLFNKMANSATILWNDGASSMDEVLKVEVNKSTMQVLGRTCDELILTCKSGIQKYYYSADLKVNPALFSNHKFGNWNEVMSRTNSLPLRIILETQQFSLECNAVEIEPKRLESKFFELPAGSKIEKGPY